MSTTTPKAPRPVKRTRARPDGAGESDRRTEIVRLGGEVIASQGFSNATVRDIADRAGILSGSLYYHFDSKEDIVDDILSAFFDRLLGGYRDVAEAAANPVQALREMIRLAFGTIETDAVAMKILHNDSAQLGRVDRFRYLWTSEEEVRRLWTTSIVEAIDAGLLRTDIDVDLMYLFAREGVWGAVRWYQPDGPRPISDVADQFVQSFFLGVATPAGKKKVG